MPARFWHVRMVSFNQRQQKTNKTKKKPKFLKLVQGLTWGSAWRSKVGKHLLHARRVEGRLLRLLLLGEGVTPCSLSHHGRTWSHLGTFCPWMLCSSSHHLQGSSSLRWSYQANLTDPSPSPTPTAGRPPRHRATQAPPDARHSIPPWFPQSQTPQWALRASQSRPLPPVSMPGYPTRVPDLHPQGWSLAAPPPSPIWQKYMVLHVPATLALCVTSPPGPPCQGLVGGVNHA